ncbi:MAG: S8 family serine peptidase [Saprospiraceae bacterium]|nr:S8 family serine peptidase [Saprospiraceae bacterium]
MWESKETIELLTSGEASTTKTRPDTSGLKSILIDTTWLDIRGTATTPPCQGSTPNPKSANIALIDSGSDLLSPRRPNGHKKLDEVYWTNRRTASGNANTHCHTDDYEGYDFVGEKGQVHDSIGHGTHLSGILKYATPSNVDLNLMNLKVCSPDPNYAYSIFDLVCAIHYAVDSGAQVINLSLGYSSDIPSLPLYNALKRAEMEDIPVVVSAGNSRQDLSAPNAGMRWPVFFKKPHGNGEFKKLDNLLVVTSINDTNNNLDSYANFGLGLVDIATVGNYFSTYSYYNSSGVYQQDWQAFKGTSQAAAYASSVIGAVKAHNPLIKTSDLFQQISRTHQPVAGLSTKLNTGGTLNAAALYRTLGLPITFTQGISARTKLGWTPGWSEIDQVLPGANVKGILKHKGARTTLNNVMLIITARITGVGGVQEVDRIYYCATDIVDWTLPSPIPANVEQYFATVYIDGVKVEPTMPITPKR